MKKTFLLLFIVTASVISFSACSGNNGKQEATADTDSVAEESEVSEVILPQLTKNGIGPIKLGMSTDSIPSKVEGLYDEYVMTKDYEHGCTITSFRKDDVEMFVTRDFGQGKVDVISLESSPISAMVGDIVIRCGESVDDVLRLNGVHPELIETDSNSFWAWKGGNFWILIDEASCGGKGELLYDVRQAPDADDLGSECKIGYIGTGLPF